MSNSNRSRKKRKSRRNRNTKDHVIYKALKNPSHIVSIVDDDGIKRWLNPYAFISVLHKSIKKHKKYLSVEEADMLIVNYEMPAIQRCLQRILMFNSSDVNESDLHKYIAGRFEHITLEMLSKDYQTKETSKFKEDLENLG